MKAYYNEIEPYAVQWLKNLIKAGLIADGDVDSRSIKDVSGKDLVGYSQVHLFAGIGGWSTALRLAGWSDECACWTGSCPCQPFSRSGRKRGFSDDRHLWPEMRRLVAECSPSTCFGEQVESAAGWLDEVGHDLENLNYAFAAASLTASSVSAPHKRSRLFFVASHINNIGRQRIGQETISRKRVFARQSTGGSSRWARGWPVYKPRVCGVADGIRPCAPVSRAYGNAIVPQVTAEFIGAYMEALDEFN